MANDTLVQNPVVNLMKRQMFDALVSDGYFDDDRENEFNFVVGEDEYFPMNVYAGTLECNKRYRHTISENTTYYLPETVHVEVDNTIVVYAYVTTDATISWGDVLFVDGDIPYIEQGFYEFVFSYHPIAEKWIVGVIKAEMGVL